MAKYSAATRCRDCAAEPAYRRAATRFCALESHVLNFHHRSWFYVWAIPVIITGISKRASRRRRWRGGADDEPGHRAGRGQGIMLPILCVMDVLGCAPIAASGIWQA